MADTFTNNLRFILQTDMANVNQWGSLYNRSVIDLVEQALAGVTIADVTAASFTLATQDGLEDTARSMILRATGNPGQTREVIVPTLDKVYVCQNDTSPGFDVEFKTTLNSGVTVPSGSRTLVWVDSVADQVRAIGASGTSVAPGGNYTTIAPDFLNDTGGDATVTINYFVQGALIHMQMEPFNTTIGDTVFEIDWTGVGGVPSALRPGEATSPDREYLCFIDEAGASVPCFLRVPPADANWEFIKADGSAWTNPSARVLPNPGTGNPGLNFMWESSVD